MPLSRPSLQTIYNRMKADMESRLTGDVKIARFSMLGILIAVFAGSIHLCYGVLVWLANQLFPDTAEADYLDRQAAWRGLTRKAASFAAGQITVTGTNGTNIPANTLYQDSNGSQYYVIAGGSISGFSVVLNVEAVVAGVSGNTSDLTLTIVNPIAGVDDIASITTPITVGANEETDDELRLRLLQFIQQPPAGGREGDYISWATEIPGVSRAWAFDSTPSAGSVTVAVAGPTNAPVDSGTLSDVQSNIDSKRPLGVNATAVNVSPALFEYNISITPNTPDIQSAITASLTDILAENTNPGGTILISQVRAAITNGGAIDYNITLVKKNGVSQSTTANIDLDGFEVPSLQSVTYATLT